MADYFIDRTGQTVSKSDMRVKFDLKVYGRSFLGKFGGLKFYVFECPKHGQQVDYSHGYTDYLDCQIEGCNYMVKFGCAQL